jgi:hypothetical protein
VSITVRIAAGLGAAQVEVMSPIEEHWIQTLTRDLRALGIADVSIEVRSADAEDWRFGVTTPGRAFEIGFNHRERFWARETTANGERHLSSNDHHAVHISSEARVLGARLIAATLARPAFPPRDPPVI